MQYFVDNIHRFYTYEEKSTTVDETTTKELIQQKSRAFGLFVAMTDLTDYEIVEHIYYDQTDSNNKFIVLNSTDITKQNNTESKNVGLEYDVTKGFVKSGASYYLKADGSFETTDSNEEVRTIRTTADCLYTIYITGAKVNTFDSWYKGSYTSDFVVFGNFAS